MKTLLDADYITRDSKAVIRLFYKDSEKGRYIEEITSFEPYFYAVPRNLEMLEEELKDLDKIMKSRVVERIDLNKKIIDPNFFVLNFKEI